MTKMNVKAPAQSPINKYLFFRGEEVKQASPSTGQFAITQVQTQKFFFLGQLSLLL